MRLTFEAELWQHEGEGGWCFVTLPLDVADEVRDAVPEGAGFGSRRVTATVGETMWQTSVFPEKRSGSFVLPVKKQVRQANDLLPGDVVSVAIEVAA